MTNQGSERHNTVSQRPVDCPHDQRPLGGYDMIHIVRNVASHLSEKSRFQTEWERRWCPGTSLLGDAADEMSPRPVTARPLARFLGQHEAHLTAWFLIGLRHLLLSARPALPFALSQLWACWVECSCHEQMNGGLLLSSFHISNVCREIIFKYSHHWR